MECEPTVFPMDEQKRAAYSFRKANVEAINHYIENYNFESLFSISDLDEMIDNFYDIIYDVFERFVPKASVKKSSNPVWFNKELCNLKNSCNRQFKKLCAAKKSNENADATKYENLRRNFEELKVSEYDKFVNDLALNSKSNPKEFWKFVNGKCKSESLPCKVTHNGKTAVSNIDKANLFAEFFSSVYIERPVDTSRDH